MSELAETSAPLEPAESSGMRGVKDIAFGSVSCLFPILEDPLLTIGQKIAGMVSKVFEHPFDLCKVRLQAQVLDATARFKGPVDCLKTTWKKEGVRGLYRVSTHPQDFTKVAVLWSCICLTFRAFSTSIS